jgi:hypothetical protein
VWREDVPRTCDRQEGDSQGIALFACPAVRFRPAPTPCVDRGRTPTPYPGAGSVLRPNPNWTYDELVLALDAYHWFDVGSHSGRRAKPRNRRVEWSTKHRANRAVRVAPPNVRADDPSSTEVRNYRANRASAANSRLTPRNPCRCGSVSCELVGVRWRRCGRTPDRPSPGRAPHGRDPLPQPPPDSLPALLPPQRRRLGRRLR